MTKITSITLSYDTPEDRIHVAVKLEDGQAVRLWVTQRLARALVVALGQHLEKLENIPLSTVRDAMLEQEQAHAVSNIKPSQPVQAGQDAPAYLVQNITAGISQDHVKLEFVSDFELKPAIVFDRTQIRQWLTMLQRQFEKGGWPLDVWPAWLIEGSQPPGDAETRH